MPLAPDHSEIVSLRGTVVSVQANYYWVQLDRESLDPTASKLLLCTRRARLKKVGQDVMVGDLVQIEEPDWEGQRGAIAAVYPRATQLDRPPIANADQILLVFALAEPDLDPYQLTRFLVTAEQTGLEVCLCLNKRDLIPQETEIAWEKRLQSWGYSPVFVSVQYDTSLPKLTAALENRVTVVSGPSGVGKSSLINKLIPTVTQRVKAVSGKLGRGRHTTRHVELFELPAGGLLADTPGFNQPDLICTPENLGKCFPEIRDRLLAVSCQFTDCLHQGEPGCGISTNWERYTTYLELLQICIDQTQTLMNSANPEAAYKIKITESGQVQHEPRLAPKKYRQVSRRRHHQSLQELRYELSHKVEDLEALESEELDG